MATPLTNLQAALASLTAEIAEIEGQTGPDMSVGGVTVNVQSYLAGLYERLEKLMKIPGVAPDLTPVFTVYG